MGTLGGKNPMVGKKTNTLKHFYKAQNFLTLFADFFKIEVDLWILCVIIKAIEVIIFVFFWYN